MILKKYIGKEVEVATLKATGYRSWTEKSGEVNITQRENIEDNIVTGTATEATADSITVAFDYRGKSYSFEINQSAIAWVLVTSLNESGRAQSERMKAKHAKAEK